MSSSRDAIALEQTNDKQKTNKQVNVGSDNDNQWSIETFANVGNAIVTVKNLLHYPTC